MKSTHKTIIIEDDESSSSSLVIMIKKYFPNLVISAIGTSVKDGKELINKIKPDLVFLDIELPDGNAFEILENANPIDFEIIFTTSFNEFAVRAFEFSAIHYLLKPIEPDKFVEAVNRFFNATINDNFENKFSVLKESLAEKPQKIVLPSSDGYNIYNIDDIVKCVADTSYTSIYIISGEKVVVSKSLLNFEKILSTFGFIRIHSKYLINMRYIKKYRKTFSPEIILCDGSELPVSKTYKNSLDTNINKFLKLQ